MLQKCEKNVRADFGEVVEGLDINIAQALASGDVRSTGVALVHNNVNTPNGVLGKPRDIFSRLDAIDEANAHLRAKRGKMSDEGVKSSEGAGQASSGPDDVKPGAAD